MKHPSELTALWDDKELTLGDIIPKVIGYSLDRRVPVTPEEAESIARQIYRGYIRYHNQNEYGGDFIEEFAGDSIRRVLGVADNLNSRVLIIYHYYFYNCAPGDWRERIERRY